MKFFVILAIVAYAHATPKYQCEYGPSYWCSNLNIAKGCGAVKHCMDTTWRNQDLSNIKESDVCQYCEEFIGDVKAQFNNQTEAEIKQFLDEACSIIPDTQLADECKQQVDDNIVEIFEMIRKSLDPKSICSAIGICPGFRDFVAHKKAEQDLHKVKLFKNVPNNKVTGDICKDCKAFIGDVADLIDSNVTEDEISKELKEQVCAQLGSFESECDGVVDSYLPEIMELIKQSVDPDTVCQALGVCQGDKFILQRMRLQKSKFFAKKEKSGDFCAVCEMVFQELQTLLKEDTVQADVKNFLKKNLCSKLGSYQQECEQDVDEYGSLIFELVTSELDPTSICTALSLCGQKKIEHLKNVKISVECVLCEFIMKELESALSKNATEEEIIKALDNVCRLLPDTISQECKSFIEEYGKGIILILEEEVDPKEVCTSLKLCQSKIDTKYTKSKAEGDELCGVCETIIQYLVSILDKNATVVEIESAMKKVCNHVPDEFKSECKDFINQYGPMIIGLIIDEASPHKVCSELKLCPASILPVPVLEPVIVPQKAQLVGINECTYGPSYWCQSYQNAKKCKGTKYCITHVWKNGVPRL